MKKQFIITFLITLLSIVLVSCDTKNTNEFTIKPADGSLAPYLDNMWVNVWHDEFNGDTLDLSKWTYELGGHGWGNNELQNYTNKNVEVSNGTMKIHVKEETRDNNGKRYSSSRIVSKNKGDFKYGRFQAMIKLPRGRGLWPAFWMMPTKSVYGGWPKSGEIDIMEYVGYNPGVGYTTIHTEKHNGMNGKQIGHSYDMVDETEVFQLFEIIWLPGIITSYVDGIKVGQFRYVPGFNQDGPHNETFPFDQEFFLIFNVAVGGNWGGIQGIDDTIFPGVMEVDYVRVYELDANYLDKENPSIPGEIKPMNGLKNAFYWNESKDDTAINYYEVYINNELYKTANLNSVVLDNSFDVGEELNIKVRAVDMVGNFSEFSESLSYIYK